jgi:hypothetical protein
MDKFLFYKELSNGEYIVVNDLSQSKAKRLYNQALKDVNVVSSGWELIRAPLSLSNVLKLKKGNLV